MPALAFLASVGLALVAMLFAANAMLPDNGPVIVVSERIGLPEPWHPDPDPDIASRLRPDTGAGNGLTVGDFNPARVGG